MTSAPEFALVETQSLREHEEVVPADVDRLVAALLRSRVVKEPILVSREDRVILNGHHRYAALRRLGASRVPVWFVDYADARIELKRWKSGPAITKAEVVTRAREGRLFPPKTTRHVVRFALPSHPTAFEELFAETPPGGHSAEAVQETVPLRSRDGARAPDSG